MKIGIGIGIAVMLAACGNEEPPRAQPLEPFCVRLCPLPERGIGFTSCRGFSRGACDVPGYIDDDGCTAETRFETSLGPRECHRDGPVYCVQTCPRHDGECWVSNSGCGKDWIAGEGCQLATVRRTTAPRFDCVPDGGVGDGGLDAGPGDR
jgi:hypothetical protein